MIEMKKAEESLKYYKGYEGKTIDETMAINVEFERLKAIASEQEADKKFVFKDFCKSDFLFFY